jgi:hypothetical protein
VTTSSFLSFPFVMKCLNQSLLSHHLLTEQVFVRKVLKNQKLHLFCYVFKKTLFCSMRELVFLINGDTAQVHAWRQICNHRLYMWHRLQISSWSVFSWNLNTTKFVYTERTYTHTYTHTHTSSLLPPSTLQASSCNFPYPFYVFWYHTIYIHLCQSIHFHSEF